MNQVSNAIILASRSPGSDGWTRRAADQRVLHPGSFKLTAAWRTRSLN